MKYIAPLLVLLASCFMILQAFVMRPATDDWFLPLLQLSGGVIMLSFAVGWIIVLWLSL